MKKVLSLILVLAMCLALCSCGAKESEPEFDPKEEFKSKVNAAVAVECMFSYSDVKTAITNLSDITVDGDVYTGKGKVTIRDSYGDTYVGKVTAEYRYNAETQSFTKIDLDIEQPKKQ
ncbi:MAG: hypothetical protein E7316_05380 [Clostridiales bacterium]|nr:hypothetical protein [Clostridiales bacterium]